MKTSLLLRFRRDLANPRFRWRCTRLLLLSRGATRRTECTEVKARGVSSIYRVYFFFFAPIRMCTSRTSRAREPLCYRSLTACELIQPRRRFIAAYFKRNLARIVCTIPPSVATVGSPLAVPLSLSMPVVTAWRQKRKNGVLVRRPVRSLRRGE